MPKKPNYTLTPEEIAEFRAAMKEVKPLTATERATVTKKPRKAAPSKKLQLHQVPAPAQNHLSDPGTYSIQPGDNLFFARAGLQHKVIQNLRKGRHTQTAILDLHGMTVEQARAAVNSFIQHSCQTQQRFLRIIHGKGQTKLGTTPILKNHVNYWLQQFPEVLAFCSAQPRDGGAGAVYVLIKAGL